MPVASRDLRAWCQPLCRLMWRRGWDLAHEVYPIESSGAVIKSWRKRGRSLRLRSLLTEARSPAHFRGIRNYVRSQHHKERFQAQSCHAGILRPLESGEYLNLTMIMNYEVHHAPAAFAGFHRKRVTSTRRPAVKSLCLLVVPARDSHPARIARSRSRIAKCHTSGR